MRQNRQLQNAIALLYNKYVSDVSSGKDFTDCVLEAFS